MKVPVTGGTGFVAIPVAQERLAGSRPGMVDIEAAPGLEGPPA